MTRRKLLLALPMLRALAGNPAAPLVVPIHHLIDRSANLSKAHLDLYWRSIWPEAAKTFGACGIQLDSHPGDAKIERPPGREPVVHGIDFGVINLVVTSQVPMEWDNGRSLNGMTTLYRGRPLCLVALYHAHGNQFPLLSVNTCVHELLHALLEDIFERRPRGMQGEMREARVDSYATRMWLFHDGAAVRRAAAEYLQKLSRPV